MPQASANITFTTGISATGVTLSSSNGHSGIGWFQGLSLVKSVTQKGVTLNYDDFRVLDTTVSVDATQQFSNMILTLRDTNGIKTGTITCDATDLTSLAGISGYYTTDD